MFDDIIKEPKPYYDKEGCWNCKFTTPHYPNVLYCRHFKKYMSTDDGSDCEMYEERKK